MFFQSSFLVQGMHTQGLVLVFVCGRDSNLDLCFPSSFVLPSHYHSNYLFEFVSIQLSNPTANDTFLMLLTIFILTSRFKDWSSERSLSSNQEYPIDDGLYPKKTRPIGRILGSIQRGYERVSERITSLKNPLSTHCVDDWPRKESGLRKTVLDPQSKFLQTWNKIFVLSCVISLALDPLFFYIPVMTGEKKCFNMDRRLAIIASFLRSLGDAFYVLHIIFQFRTGFIRSSSQVFGRGELIDDPVAIAKRYISTHFIIDILAVLPLPQVSV